MVGQRLGEQPGDVGRPHVLVLEVDQPPGPLDRLRVAAGHRPLAVRGEVVRRADRRVGPQVLHEVRSALRWRRELRRQRVGVQPGVVQLVVDPGDRVVLVGAVGVVPALAEDGVEHVHGRPADLQLDVVPRRVRPVGRRPSAAAAGRRRGRRRRGGRSRGRSRRRTRRPSTGPRRAAGPRSSGGGCPSGGSAGRGSPRHRRARSPGPASGWPPCSSTAAPCASARPARGRTRRASPPR